MPSLIQAVAVMACFLVSGCSAPFWQGVAQGMAAVGSTSASAGGVKLMIFGGENHDVYLGCLNCSEYATDSVLNEYGSYGSVYAATSIHNDYGRYGSAYSSLRPCNPYATDPPVMVDDNGTFYGYLTVNEYKSGAISHAAIRTWLKGVCGG